MEILNSLSIYDLTEGIDYIFDSEQSDEELLDKRVNDVFDALEKISVTSENDYNLLDSELKSIKMIFRDSRILYKLKSFQNINRLEVLFSTFNFKFILLSFKELHSLIALSQKSLKKYLIYLNKKRYYSYLEIKSIEHILFQKLDFNIKEINNLKFSISSKIVNQGLIPFKYFTNKLKFDSKKYYISYLDKFKQNFGKFSDKYIAQIRYRVISEKTNNYDNALNHLLNQIHQLVYDVFKDIIGKGKFDADDCINKLYGINGLEIKYVIGLKKLFNRRNNNPISHSGLDGEIAWSVRKDEYYTYREIVFNIEEVLLNIF